MAMFTRSIEPREGATIERAPTDERAVGWRLSTNAMVLIAFVVLCEAAGVVGAMFTETGPDSWYAGLDKPAFNPPSWVFAPVWTVLYALMGFGAWRVWRRLGPEPDRSRALVVFGVQLLLNALWTPIFFGAEAPYLSMLVITALWLAVLGMLLTFAPVDPFAAVLNLPYFGWVTFAVAINAGILILQ
jgi:translocator protein